jgi:crotonobetainyl-CoA:carnitine CoA-transferase CaiB-like acyl-CoA transferase
MPATAPLKGLIVIEIGTSVAAPTAALIFAELGADVFKIEGPGGDDARNWGPPFADGAACTFNAINRNKKSVVVDFKNESECSALRDFIVARADIVIQNLRPGVVDKFQLDAKTLRARKPALIYCNLSAFGSRGPMKMKPGYDPLMQAIGGIMSITGEDGRDPVRVGPSLVDQGSGMWSVIGILSALRERDRSGEGCEIGTSLYETALSWTSMHTANYMGTNRVPKRIGSEQTTIAPYKAYGANDGFIVIAAGNDNLFRRLAMAFDRPEWSDDPKFKTNPDRVQNRARLNKLITDIVAGNTRAHWQQKLDDAGVPCAPMQTLDEVVAHPQTTATGMMQPAPNGGMPLYGLPLEFNGERPQYRSKPPKLGEHTDMVLKMREGAK